jgi:hypothetical protein
MRALYQPFCPSVVSRRRVASADRDRGIITAIASDGAVDAGLPNAAQGDDGQRAGHGDESGARIGENDGGGDQQQRGHQEGRFTPALRSGNEGQQAGAASERDLEEHGRDGRILKWAARPDLRADGRRLQAERRQQLLAKREPREVQRDQHGGHGTDRAGHEHEGSPARRGRDCSRGQQSQTGGEHQAADHVDRVRPFVRREQCGQRERGEGRDARSGQRRLPDWKRSRTNDGPRRRAECRQQYCLERRNRLAGQSYKWAGRFERRTYENGKHTREADERRGAEILFVP